LFLRDTPLQEGTASLQTENPIPSFAPLNHAAPEKNLSTALLSFAPDLFARKRGKKILNK
jgi:hypothetical protein